MDPAAHAQAYHFTQSCVQGIVVFVQEHQAGCSFSQCFAVFAQGTIPIV